MLSIHKQNNDGQMLSDTLNLIISLQTHMHICKYGYNIVFKQTHFININVCMS